MAPGPGKEARQGMDPSLRQDILGKLRDVPGTVPPAELWRRFEPPELPALLRLLDVAAGLPRLAGQGPLAELDASLWPELDAVASDVVALQRLADHPTVLPSDEPARCRTSEELDAAVRELADEHCTTIDFFFPEAARPKVDALVEEVASRRTESWGALERGDVPALFELTDQAVRSPSFRALTGFDADRDVYTLTISLQDLDATGIGWHRDLYWPREWIGEDVFAVLYGLTSDTPELGGAFLYWVEERGCIRSIYRQRHQATVIWNGRTTAGRPLHAVSGYLTDRTARHHLHLQCLRRSP